MLILSLTNHGTCSARGNGVTSEINSDLDAIKNITEKFPELKFLIFLEDIVGLDPNFVFKVYRDYYAAIDVSSLSGTVVSATMVHTTTSSIYNGHSWKVKQITGNTVWDESTFCPNQVTIGSQLASGNVASQLITYAVDASIIQALMASGDLYGEVVQSGVEPPTSFDDAINRIIINTSEASSNVPYLQVVTNP